MQVTPKTALFRHFTPFMPVYASFDPFPWPLSLFWEQERGLEASFRVKVRYLLEERPRGLFSSLGG